MLGGVGSAPQTLAVPSPINDFRASSPAALLSASPAPSSLHAPAIASAMSSATNSGASTPTDRERALTLASSRASDAGMPLEGGVPTVLSNIAHLGFVRVVVAGGESCGLLAHKTGVNAAIAMLLRELASSEIAFVNSLRDTLRSWLLPFAKAVRSDPSQYFPIAATKDAFDTLNATHSEIWHLACTSATQFSVASSKGHYGNMLEVFERLEPLKVYQR